MRILIDFDDVIYPTLQETIDICNKKNGTDYKFEDIKGYFNIPSDIQECFKLVEYTGTDKNNAVELVKKLCKKHDVYILTASIHDNLYEKIDWIETYLPEIGWEKTIVARNKQMVDGDVIIDDAWHNIIGHKAKYKFLYNAPHNTSVKPSDRIIRIDSLEKVIEVLGDGE